MARSTLEHIGNVRTLHYGGLPKNMSVSFCGLLKTTQLWSQAIFGLWLILRSAARMLSIPLNLSLRHLLPLLLCPWPWKFQEYRVRKGYTWPIWISNRLCILFICAPCISLINLKRISRKKAAPWIFAHYLKIYNFFPILMKLGENDQLMRWSFPPSFIRIE